MSSYERIASRLAGVESMPSNTDELAAALREVADKIDSKSYVSRSEIQRRLWYLTESLGSLKLHGAPSGVDDEFKAALDEVMYELENMPDSSGGPTPEDIIKFKEKKYGYSPEVMKKVRQYLKDQRIL